MRKCFVLAALILSTALMAVPARAQDETKVQVFGGYSYMRYDPSNVDVSLNGWNASAEYQFFHGLGIVGDFAGDYGSPQGLHSSMTTYLFGPQIAFPARVSPFAHVLFGGAHLSVAGATDNSFAVGYGAGFDVHVTHNLGVRIIEIDDIYTRFANYNQNSPRISAGITFRF
jgi:Outer membrane protein beta-barrel domain